MLGFRRHKAETRCAFSIFPSVVVYATMPETKDQIRANPS